MLVLWDHIDTNSMYSETLLLGTKRQNHPFHPFRLLKGRIPCSLALQT